MNVLPVSNNNQNFKGSLVLNNFKTNVIEEMITTKKIDRQLSDSFERIINEQTFINKTPAECLTNLKEYVNKLNSLIGGSFVKNVKYPSGEDVTIICREENGRSGIIVPGYFSIMHFKK